MGRIPVALQMYTLRDDAGKDFIGTLKRVAALGYAGVEFAGTYGMAAAELKKVTDDLGLQVVGSHVGLETLESDLSAALDYNAALGNRYIVCPYLSEDRRKSGDAYRRLGETFNKIGEACQARDMQFCYHNHAFEFETFDGQTGFDILFGATDPKLVQAELDVYWVAYGGADPLEIIRRFRGRAPLIHLKDMAKDEKRSFAEVGEGTLDFDAICAAAAEGGAVSFIVEQDVCARPPLESVEISLRNLKAKGLA